VTAIVLVLISMLSLAALDSASQENTAGARSRSTTRSLHVADAGVQLALSRLSQSPPDLTAFDIDLTDGANVQSRTRSETTPQDLGQAGIGEAEEGYAVNVGVGAGFVHRVYRLNVTATAGGSTAEVEAKLSRSEADAISY
jgi:hypothetical protein